jgi:hypothetical protein
MLTELRACSEGFFLMRIQQCSTGFRYCKCVLLRTIHIRIYNSNDLSKYVFVSFPCSYYYRYAHRSFLFIQSAFVVAELKITKIRTFLVEESSIFQVTLWSAAAFVQTREFIKSFFGFDSYENSFLFVSRSCNCRTLNKLYLFLFLRKNIKIIFDIV